MAVAVELVMPRLSESMEEGTVVSWLVADGAPVTRGQEIAEIETDKATLPYEAPEGGVLRILVPEGTTLPLGSPIGLIDDLAAIPGTPQAGSPAEADDDPPTETFEVHPAGPGEATQAWSPAWGPQPRPQTPADTPPQQPGARPPLQHPAHASTPQEDEGETTEFDAIDLSGVIDAPQAPLAPPVPPPPLAPAPQAPAPAVEATAPPAPWVDPAGQAPPVAAEPAASAVDPSVEDERRYAAEELIAPPTLAPRPPELQPAPSAQAQRVVASPVARRLASELGIDLSTLTGTGPEGRIVRADIEAAQAQGAARPPLPASAARAAASEFTPPVDDARAAAPIPEPEPEPELLFEDEPTTEAAVVPGASAEDAEPVDVVLPEPESTVDPSPDVEAPEPDASADEAEPEPVAGVPSPDPADEAEPVAVEPSPDPADEAEPVAVEPSPDPAAAAEQESLPEPVVDAEPVAVADAEPVAEPEAPAAPAPARGKGEPTIVELTRQQQTVARRMSESKATIPDFATTVEVDAGPLLTLRADLRSTRPDLTAPSVNDLLVKAVAIALRAFPRLNGGYRDGRLELYPRINVGIATDAEGSLLVPVIHDADALSVGQIAARTDELLAKAADGSLRPPDIASATFTISNLGMYGVDEFSAVITPGQAAILTAGAIAERPVIRNGAVVAGQTLRLTLTTDHRAVYGVEAARFLGRVRQLIEHPSSLLA